MMRGLVLLCAIASPVSALLLKRGHHHKRREPTARVYVMNMPENRERCDCMQTQLVHSPFPVTRFEGANHHHKESLKNCSEVQNMKHQKGNIPAYLVCTNYMIWKEAVKEDETDFIIVFEDDATLGHKGGKEHFWGKVQNMLRNCDNFDYLSVDTFGGWTDTGFADTSNNWAFLEKEKSSKPPAEGICNANFETLQGWGAHMQIIRRTALPKLIKTVKQGQWGPMDHWSDFTSSIRKYHWNANIVKQSSQDTHKVASHCDSKGMHKSTLSLKVEPGQSVDMAETENEGEAMTKVFQCPHDPNRVVDPVADEKLDPMLSKESFF